MFGAMLIVAAVPLFQGQCDTHRDVPQIAHLSLAASFVCKIFTAFFQALRRRSENVLEVIGVRCEEFR